MRKRSWDETELLRAVKVSTSVRQVLNKLGLIEAGGNYEQIKSAIRRENIDISHFVGRGWRRRSTVPVVPAVPLVEVLVEKSYIQSFKLKKRLFAEGLKVAKCEMCGWAKKSEDGRIPIELDHMNGNRYDNRLENLRILCPNCHSLQSTHRGRNKKRRGGEMVDA